MHLTLEQIDRRFELLPEYMGYLAQCAINSYRLTKDNQSFMPSDLYWWKPLSRLTFDEWLFTHFFNENLGPIPVLSILADKLSPKVQLVKSSLSTRIQLMGLKIYG